MTQPPDPIELAAVARLEESRIARGLSAIAGEHRLIGAPTLEAGAAVAGFDGPGSMLNAIVNLGMNGPVDAAVIEDLAREYVSRGIEPAIELCPYADGSVAAACVALGFVINPRRMPDGASRGFETVLFRELVSTGDVDTTRHPEVPAGITIVTVDPKDEARVREFADLCISRDSPASPIPPASAFGTVVKCVNHPGTVSLAALMDGRVIGVGSIELAGEICSLFNAKVRPEYRRRGIQSALLAARLAIGMERGCRIATIGSRPGISTERNVRRMGFQVAYTKLMMVKPGPGLRGVGS